MAYCTIADMLSRFGESELVQLTNPGGTVVDEAVLGQVILDAAAEIEAYLGGRYALPLNPVPKVLVRIACNLARYYLYDNESNEAVEKGREDAVGFLKSVAKGDIRLGIASDGGTAVQTESTSAMQADNPVWGRAKSGGFI